MEIILHSCDIKDLDTIIRIGKETYYDTFKYYCSKETMDAYLAEAFSATQISSELANRNSFFYIAYLNKQIAGYLKLNIKSAQSDLKDQNGLEIERIYVLNTLKRKGIGTQLVIFSIKVAKEKNMDFVWLGVWEKNHSAINSYIKNGFEKSGSHTFRMGTELQTDYIMRKYI